MYPTYVKAIEYEIEYEMEGELSVYLVVLCRSLFFSRFFLLDLRGDVTRRDAPYRASVAGGRSQSGVNPVDRHGDTGIRQREHVVLIFRISLWPRLSSLFFSRPFFEIAHSMASASASEIIRVEALYT